MKKFNVWLNGKKIDGVYFNSSDIEEVRVSLIRYDSYDENIKVTLAAPVAVTE